ncbi:hypothetical protein ACZ90_01445 [Streptomyces albus subsp. albus]|nr:hypothetical protein ACZ90_01445 [Streptomyces albus subsp. albus]
MGQPSSGTGGNTRTSAVRPVTVMPGSVSARRHSAPRARRTTLRIRASCQSRTACAHTPSGDVARSSDSRVSTARAAVSSASVLAGGAAFSIRTTRGSTNCGAASRSRSACRYGLLAWSALSVLLLLASELVTDPVCQPAGAPGRGGGPRPAPTGRHRDGQWRGPASPRCA